MEGVEASRSICLACYQDSNLTNISTNNLVVVSACPRTEKTTRRGEIIIFQSAGETHPMKNADVPRLRAKTLHIECGGHIVFSFNMFRPQPQQQHNKHQYQYFCRGVSLPAHQGTTRCGEFVVFQSAGETYPMRSAYSPRFRGKAAHFQREGIQASRSTCSGCSHNSNITPVHQY